MIINISKPAKDELNKMFEAYSIKDKYIRIYIKEVSAWYGPMFSLALDEPNQYDKTFESDGCTVILAEGLYDKIHVINIYYKSALSSDIFRVSTDLIWSEEYYGLPWARP